MQRLVSNADSFPSPFPTHHSRSLLFSARSLNIVVVVPGGAWIFSVPLGVVFQKLIECREVKSTYEMR